MEPELKLFWRLSWTRPRLLHYRGCAALVICSQCRQSRKCPNQRPKLTILKSGTRINRDTHWLYTSAKCENKLTGCPYLPTNEWTYHFHHDRSRISGLYETKGCHDRVWCSQRWTLLQTVTTKSRSRSSKLWPTNRFIDKEFGGPLQIL